MIKTPPAWKNSVADWSDYFRRSVIILEQQDIVKRGEIYYADLSPVVGSEQGGIRPVLIVQNNVGNRYSPTVIAAAITSQQNKAKMPTHIELSARTYGLAKDSIVLLEQIRTLDKRRLRERMGCLDEAAMQKVDSAIAISFGLGHREIETT
ncbi:MAG: type II toxin-antitoxin system PemK/MazF family toxin [Oscillospiraceae bacterium]|nr:type II toxin-antitoxin system PemK/MazF family toxin [Oscillospiraceae bacterium]